MGSIADIAAALAALSDEELQSLRGAIGKEPAIVPSLSVWLGAATDWEINRRAGSSHHELRAPRADIGDGEVECGLVALAILYSSFRNVERVASFLDLTAGTLCADAQAIGSWRKLH